MQILYIIAFVLTSWNTDPVVNTEEGIQWVSWEEAVELNKTAPRKIFVDMYTDWCGWCKKMDKSTFVDADVVKYISENFYAVKFNAEQKEDIQYSGNTFKFVKTGRRGIHQLAYALLNGRASYPSFVYLDETFSRIMISPGFKQPLDIMPELQFAFEEKYKDMSWEEYKVSMGLGTIKAKAAKVDKAPPKKKKAAPSKLETMPRFPGCENQKGKDECARQKLFDYINANIVYPDQAKSEGKSGMPIVQFFVEVDGSVSNITVLRDGENGFGPAAKKVISSMNSMDQKWIPAVSTDGQKMRSKYVVPIKFKLDQTKK